MVPFMIESSTPSNGIKCKGMMRVHSFLDDCVQGYHRNGMYYFLDYYYALGTGISTYILSHLL